MIRENDRDFRVGDTLVLEEFDPKVQKYTGSALAKAVTYIIGEPFAKDGTVIMSIANYKTKKSSECAECSKRSNIKPKTEQKIFEERCEEEYRERIHRMDQYSRARLFR